ncbi:hypothetical protein VTN77DRAFT_3350 [Rasamsonia byssochlamydoides]|uniref:uncharacterized protein n=1 Tax=Rasamsonia byssochlamydoides TaxID=89139 RepID=UPI0037436B89
MSAIEKVLSVSLNLDNKEEGEEEQKKLDHKFLYRIQRGQRIIYVKVLDEDILPLSSLIHSKEILSKLRELPRWNDNDWTTLTVSRNPDNDNNGQIETFPDLFAPHSVGDVRALSLSVSGVCQDSLLLFDILTLTPVTKIKDRVSRVAFVRPYDGFVATMILKIAKFEHELEDLKKEIRVYSLLMARGCRAAPRLLGYAYEERTDRIVGILIEDIWGRPAEIGDLQACQNAVREIHDAGILHNDLNPFNFVVSEARVKIIDFETAEIGTDGDGSKRDEEMQGLADKLLGERNESPTPTWVSWRI